MNSPQTVWVASGIIYAINFVLVCMRPEIAMEFGSTKWNRYVVSGLPTDSPLFYFGTVKNSPGLYELDQKSPLLCA